MSEKKIQLVPNKPRKPTGKVVNVQPNDITIKSKAILRVVSDKHEKK